MMLQQLTGEMAGRTGLLELFGIGWRWLGSLPLKRVFAYLGIGTGKRQPHIFRRTQHHDPDDQHQGKRRKLSAT
ncbi:hypothetical protein [Vibrio fluvialis]|uniref:hypothetical protein n=1 Tax=Vibrio fluvialis TaxID=676 RepID=UPI00192C69F6|nr:hypothetical protein [Vibrio fluvialis]MBL4281254.1 hypothetical protein [Vibrio fluvialis]